MGINSLHIHPTFYPFLSFLFFVLSFLPRASLNPPDALLQQVFPAIDERHYRLKHGDGVEHNFALEGYLHLLFFFCEVIFTGCSSTT